MDILKRALNKYKNLDKRKKSYLIAIGIIIAIMSWAFLSAGFITANFNRSQVEGLGDEQKVDAQGIIITETKDGKKYFEIYGETGNYTNDRKIATLNNIVGNFYKDNEVGMSFQSSKGTYNEETGIITLYNHTYIVLNNETSLEADKLTWYGSGKDTIAEGNVKIKKGKDFAATCEKCIIGADYDKFKIAGKTKTQIFSDKEK